MKIKSLLWLITWLLAFYMAVLLCLSVVGFFTEDIPWAMFGGDCVESSSIGGATIEGIVEDISGNPLEGVTIVVEKDEGWCPQSIPQYLAMVSGPDGTFAGGSLWVHLGDPDLRITVLAERRAPYQLRVDAAQNRNSLVELKVIVGEHIQVQSQVRDEDSIREWATLTARMTPSPPSQGPE